MDSKYRIELADNSKGSSNMDSNSLGTVIKVIGVGNGGCNAVNRMIEEGLQDVDFIAMNTDKQALSRSNAETKIVLGERVTQGLGAGTDPEKGAEAAREDIAKIEEIINGANLVFIASSFGGGTGTGASPVVAEIAKKCGALTIGVVTKPFKYEGKFKMKKAEAGIEKMFSVVDSLIIIPNENLYDMIDAENYGYTEAFSVIDDILRQGVQGISDIITKTGFGVNVDFADVKTMIELSNGRAHLGIGIGKGENRIEKAISNAFENPLLDVSSIRNSKGVLANIVTPKDFALKEFERASEKISEYAHEEANIKIGTCIDENLNDEIRVTIVATGFDDNCVKEEKEKNKIDDIENKDSETDEMYKTKDNKNIADDNNSDNSSEIKIDKNENINDKLETENNFDLKKDINKESVKTSFSNINFANKFKNETFNNNYRENINKNIETENLYNNSNDSNNIENSNNYNNFNNNEEKTAEKSEYSVFNRNVINNRISENSEFDKNEDNYSIGTAVADIEEAEELREVKKDNEISKQFPFQVMSNEERKIHNDMGAKSYIFGADTSSASTDYDNTPAFLRRDIIARNVKKIRD